MSRFLPIVIGLTLLVAVSASGVNTGNRTRPMRQWSKLGDPLEQVPAGLNTHVRADTFWFGDYQYLNGLYYARWAKNDKASVTWTFDRGNGPPDTGVPLLQHTRWGDALPNGEGWFVQDLTVNSSLHWRVVSDTLNLGDYPVGMGGGLVLPPVLIGSNSLWVGVDKPQADGLCWTCGAGYGNNWCQRVTSEPIAYDGAGTVKLTLTYFNDSEECFDGTQIYLKTAAGDELLMNPYPGGCPSSPGWGASGGGFTGRIGVNTSVPPGTPWLVAPVTWTTQDFTSDDILGGAQDISFIIEYLSDGGLSSEDCGGDFVWGPFAADNIIISGTGVTPKTYTFETGLENWTPGVCAAVGDYTSVAFLNPGIYSVKDPCGCKLAGNIIEMAAEASPGHFVHPVGQDVGITSPICNLAAVPGMPSSREVFVDLDLYAELPYEGGACIAIYWKYYPYICTINQTADWSAPVGVIGFGNPGGGDPVCETMRFSGAGIGGVGVPPSAQMVVAMVELISNCDTFAITNCSGVTNFTPIFDNFVVGVTGARNAPSITTGYYGEFQDVGSYPSGFFDVRAPGPANVGVASWDPLDPIICLSNMVVTGPVPSGDPNTHWDARMYWRVAKRGAFQADVEDGVATAYKAWKDRVADSKAIDRSYRPEFTFGYMDSGQTVDGLVVSGAYVSRFHERDEDFLGESSASDMLPDDIFRPGTRIEYFFTSNYVASPDDRYYYPDTAGGSFLEFEILPGVRIAQFANCGGTGLNYCAYHPATLYIDAFNNGSQIYIENALRTILNGYPPCTVDGGCKLPYDRNWDRYDYYWGNAPFARGSVDGSNNGLTLNQILGYRAILMSGWYGAEEDYQLFDQWLVSPDCVANTNRQFLALNGDDVGSLLEILPQYGLPFLNNTLGATLECDAFNGVTSDPACQPEEEAYCVRLQQVGASAPYFPTLIDVDAYGSWCPERFGFDVFLPDPGKGGVGNRIYQAEEGGKAMQYEQVIRYNSDSDANYKTVIDGVGWHHMTRRNGAGSGAQKCPKTTADIVEGVIAELRAALRWGFDVADDDGIPKLANVKDLAVCQNTWSTIPSDVGEGAGALRVNRLFQNEPNPFSPRTTIKFSLAQSGSVEIVIYDVNGRQVRKLVDRPMDPGSYSVIWDGTNDSDHRVGSGVYWIQMKAGSFVSNMKMIVLR